jgi:hypothetical protein
VGGRDGGRYGSSDHEQRDEDGHLQAEVLRHELRPDEDQDRGQPVVQVDEAVDQAFQREVEGPQSQDGEHDRRVGHGGGLGYREYRGHGVQAKRTSEDYHDDQRGEQRRGAAFAGLPHEEVVAVVVLGDQHETPEVAQHAVILVVGLFTVVVGAAEHAKARENQESAEDED